MPDERETTFVIADDEFHRQLDLLRRTRRFLLAEGVQAIRSPDGESPFSLGGLNLVRPPVIRFFGSGKGATLEQWSYLEKKQDALQSYFSTDLQHRFRLQATQRVIISMPILLLLTAFLALALGVFAESFDASASAQAGWRFVAFLAWTSCLGGLGAIGFIAVNSLAIQDDATFDISNKSLVVMRIVLGGLFGCIVSLPFCFPFFNEFTLWVLSGGQLDSARGVLLLVPFLLGFSTTLVMAVLNRMIGGVESIFGIERRAATRGAPAEAHPKGNERHGPAVAPPRGGEVARLQVERAARRPGAPDTEP